MAIPISDLVFHIKRSAVDGKATTLAGIDRGCSLTKAVYLPKSEEEDTETHYAFHCVLFHNDNFFDCLQLLKKNARLPDSGVIRVTGAGCDRYREEIQETLGLDVEFINEHLSIISGFYQFMRGVDDHEELFYPRLEARSYQIQRTEATSKIFDDMVKDVRKNDGSDPLFPCLYVIIGSGCGFIIVYADGSTKIIGGAMTGGKTLIGLGSVVAGIDNYDELMAAAILGQAGNVDTTIGDIMSSKKKSTAYSCYAMDMPTFPLGKVVDQKRSIETFDRNDRATSAVRLFACTLFSSVTAIAQSYGISKVVFGGHGIRGEALRLQFLECSSAFLKGVLDIRFIRTGGTGAFGAMVTEPKSEVKIAKTEDRDS